MMSSSELAETLQCIYGGEGTTLADQSARYRRGFRAFVARFGRGEMTVLRAPGRVNLIGEHTDYNHGYVMPMALDKDVLVFVRPRPDAVVRLANVEPGFPERRFQIALDIPSQPTGDWANYMQGPAQLVAREFRAVLRGFDALVDGSPPQGVPRGAGLSSSSALTVAGTLALLHVNSIDLRGAPLADLCGRAEWYVGTRGGIMDQFISVLAKRDHALFLDCRPSPDDEEYSYRHIPIPSGYAVVVIDSQVRHTNTGPLFNRRVAEGRIGVLLLRRRYPSITHLRDVDGHPWPSLEPLLPKVIRAHELREMGIDPDGILDSGVGSGTDTFLVRQRCRHVITENRRVLRSVAALETGDMDTFGRLLKEAHASARDDYDISTPEIETLVRLAQTMPGTVGARLTGAGWGGCIVAIMRADEVRFLGERVLTPYQQETGLKAQAFVCRSAAGAGVALTTIV